MPGETVAPAVRLTASEVRLRRALRVLAAASGLFAAVYVVNGIAGAEYPFVANSVAKDVLLVMVSLAAAADVRRFGWLTSSLVVIHLVLGSVLLAFLVAGATETGSTLGAIGEPPVADWIPLAAWCVTDFGIAAGLALLYTRAQRERHGLRYLGNGELHALRAVSEVLTGRGDGERSPDEVALDVDRYLAGFTAQGKAKLRLSLLALTWYPLIKLRPPLWMMEPGDRKRFLREQFLDEVADRRGLAWWRRQKQGAIRGAQQLCYLGFYSDPAVAERCGYRPLSAREPEVHATAHVRADPAHRPLACLTPAEVATDTLEADILVVGSGAAGATLAYELASAGREVLLVERGRHVDPAEFSEDEPTQFSALYADGALNLSTDFRFQVLQGMCVGGSTVVNNAVALRMAPETLDRWTAAEGHDCGLDPDALWNAYGEVERFLRIAPQPLGGPVLSPAWKPFLRGVTGLGLREPEWRTSVVSCNVDGCVGCGLCNTGCAYGRKLSMLDHTLPRAQREFPGRVRILSECRVDRVLRDGSRATGVRAQLGDGSRLEIRAQDVVLSAGALASSVVLRRSRIGGDHVGRHVAFNLGVPMVAEFEERVDAYKGLNITHVLEPPRDHGYVLETWYQPIVAMSLFMPGWFEQHERNMARYAHMACLGPVVASGPDAVVGPDRASRRAVKLRYRPSEEDLVKLRDGMKAAGRIMLAGGATRVMPPSFRFRDYRTAAELERLPGELRDNSDVMVNTSHPQGGNRMSRDPREGVVDPTFRVHGMENLFVCDASVFPSAILVNPQLTVMALARCASAHIA